MEVRRAAAAAGLVAAALAPVTEAEATPGGAVTASGTPRPITLITGDRVMVDCG